MRKVAALQIMIITSEAYTQLLACTPVPPETGGLLGGNENVIRYIVFDIAEKDYTRAEYKPDISYLNGMICNWNERNISFYGLFHSHPDYVDLLSSVDKDYISKILCVFSGATLYFPIVIPGKEVIPYKAYRRNETVFICKDELIVSDSRLDTN